MGRIVELLKGMFKDEVRIVGEKRCILHKLVWHQPFSGPGFGVRIIGEITEEKVKLFQEADYVLCDEMSKNGYGKPDESAFLCIYRGSGYRSNGNY